MCRPPPFSRNTIKEPTVLESAELDTDGSFETVVVAIPTVRDEDDIPLDDMFQVIQTFPDQLLGEDVPETHRDNVEAFNHLGVIDTTPLTVDVDNLEFSGDDEESFWETLYHQVPATDDRRGHIVINLTGFRFAILGRLRRILDRDRARNSNGGNGHGGIISDSD